MAPANAPIHTYPNQIIDSQDLDLMERRVQEMEKYLGIDENDLEAYQNNQKLETLEEKT